MLVWLAAGLLAASVGWKYRGLLVAATQPTPTPKPIVFDNGSVRGGASAASQATASQAPAPLPPGTLRKCLRAGASPTYTDVTCPAGYREAGVDTRRVTVVPGLAPAAAPAASRPLLRGVLGGPDERLRDKLMERAIEGSGR